MEKYIKFEIEERKFSSNALLGVFEHKNTDGGTTLKRDFLFAFGHSLKKNIADKEISKLCAMYNTLKIGKY